MATVFSSEYLNLIKGEESSINCSIKSDVDKLKRANIEITRVKNSLYTGELDIAKKSIDKLNDLKLRGIDTVSFESLVHLLKKTKNKVEKGTTLEVEASEMRVDGLNIDTAAGVSSIYNSYSSSGNSVEVIGFGGKKLI